jgi:hypothetical protein
VAVDPILYDAAVPHQASSRGFESGQFPTGASAPFPRDIGSTRVLRVAALYLVVLLVVTVSVLAYLRWPLWPDHSFFLYAGRCWDKGLLPYRDVFDQNWPGTIWISQLITRLTGPSPLGVRIFDTLWQTASACVLFLIAGRLMSRPRAVSAVVLYLALYLAASYGGTAQREGFASLVLGLACLALLREAADEITLPRSALAGSLCAAAVFIKPTLGIVPLLMVLLLLGSRYRKPARRYWLAGSAVFGAAVPLGMYALYLLHTDLGAYFVDAGLVYAAHYGHVPALWFLKRFLLFSVAYPPGRLMVLSIVLLVWTVRGCQRWPWRYRLLVVFTLGTLGSLLVQRRLAYYHAMPFCYFASALLMAAIERKDIGMRILRRFGWSESTRRHAATLLVFLLILPLGFDLPCSIASVLSGQSAADYGDRRRVLRGWAAWSALEQVREAVRAQVPPEVPVLCLAGSASPDFYLVLGRDPVDRYVVPQHMLYYRPYYVHALSTLKQDRNPKVLLLYSRSFPEEQELFRVATSDAVTRKLYEKVFPDATWLRVYLVSACPLPARAGETLVPAEGRKPAPPSLVEEQCL